MKKQLLIQALLAGSFTSVQAQNNVIKLNTIGLLLKSGSVFFEHRVDKSNSLNMGFLLANYNTNNPDLNTQFKGFALTGEWRSYFKSNSLHGLFIGPYLRYQNYRVTETLESPGISPWVGKARLVTFGGGGVMGWQKIFGSGVTIEPFLGLGAAVGKIDILENTTRDIRIGEGLSFELRPGFNIGYALGRRAE